MTYSTKIPKWCIIFEVTFYGNDSKKGSFREIKEGKINIGEDLPINTGVPYDSKENVEINFLVWIDGLPVENLVELPFDYLHPTVKYSDETIEVIEVTKF